MNPARARRGPPEAAVTVVFALVLALLFGLSAPTADAGTPPLDLGEDVHSLDSPWEFFWQKFPEPGAEDEPDARMELPGSWTGLAIDGTALPAAGHGGFRLRVALEDPPARVVLRVPMVYSAYRLYVDGERVAQVGEPGSSADESRPDYGERRVVIDNPGEELELLFHVSNFTSRAAGFPHPLELATPEVMEHNVARDLIGNAALSGGLVLLGLSQLVLFRLRQNETMYLFFGFMIVAWGMQTALTGQLLVHMGWHVPIEIARPLDGLTALTAAAFYLLFLSSLFPRELPMRYTRWVLAPLIIYLAITLLGTEMTRSEAVGWLLYFLTGMLALALAFVARAWWRGVPDAGPILLGSAVVAGSAILQILWFNEMGVRNAVANTGVLAAVALHAITLSRRYARAFERSQRLESELRRANRLKDDFLASTSHELRTPLHAMIGMAESLPREDPRQARALDLIQSSGHRLSRLVDDILSFTRLKHGDLHIRPEAIAPAPLLHTAAESVRPLLGDRPVALETEIETDLPAVRADADRLHQVLFNLLGNAVKYTDAGRIVLRARREGETVCVEVEDTGSGIAELDPERLQEPYEQGHESADAGRGGVGLGLAISRQILERHGARLELSGGADGGTRARFCLEIARASVPSAGPTSTTPAQPTGPEPAGESTATRPGATTGAHILIVEDEDSAARVLETQLGLEGYRTSRASSGEQALECIAREAPQLVLLDVMMPDMSGLTVCRRLREEHDPASLPIILVTARTREHDIVEGLQAGANDYLPKPFYRQELLARVQSQLQVHENEQMRWALEEKEAHQPDGDEEDLRTQLATLLTRSLRDWELETGLTRADLAEESGLWTVTLDDTTRKTRTLDRYCDPETLPRRPRWGLVIRTARFVAARVEDTERKRDLLARAQRIEQRLA
ncbi:response regulator [Thioalkalivibrio sp. ALgr3]|uniref:response regulator n=1 Tax=Thioalkalivibrio sp. ALgr3 TaxID=1239292 RepID=UPI0003616B4E|nr:response regulator [Thioalkalivibrio sp. ALgr3]